MKARPVVHFEIRGKDSARLREFYGTLFNWKMNSDLPIEYTLIEAGEGGPEAGVGGGIARSEQPLVTIYVQVADLDETLAMAERMGGATVQKPTDVPGGPSVAQLRDPDGNLIGLVKQ